MTKILILILVFPFLFLMACAPIPTDEDNAFEYEGILIEPNLVSGFHVHEMPIPPDRAIYIVWIMYTNGRIINGPVYETRDEAESAVIELAGMCGI